MKHIKEIESFNTDDDAQLFSRSDLVSFANFLSSKRYHRNYDERIIEVYHADVENWLEEHYESRS